MFVRVGLHLNLGLIAPYVRKRHFLALCVCKFANCQRVFHVHSVMHMLCINVLMGKDMHTVAVAEYRYTVDKL